MSRRRRRSGPPLIPGFWILVGLLLLGGSVFGYFYILARETRFVRQPMTAEP